MVQCGRVPHATEWGTRKTAAADRQHRSSPHEKLQQHEELTVPSCGVLPQILLTEPYPLKQWPSTGMALSTEDIWQCRRHFGVTMASSGVEVRDVASQHIMHRAASHREGLACPSRQACSRWGLHSYPDEPSRSQGPQDDQQAKVNTLSQATATLNRKPNSPVSCKCPLGCWQSMFQ